MTPADIPDNRWQTPEPWAAARGPRRPGGTSLVGDVHVLGALVVVHFDDGRLVLAVVSGKCLS